VKERKDRVDDAMHATRAAVEEGILPGGGVALLRATRVLEKLKVQNDDQKVGVEIVRKAISAPARQIALNAGEDGSVIVGKILEKDQYGYGFDAQMGEYVNMMSKGIIDPTKVVRAALQGGIGRRSAHHHRSHGRRKAEEGQWGPGYAWRWHGWHGLLIVFVQGNKRARRKPRFVHDSSDMPRMEKANLCRSQGGVSHEKRLRCLPTCKRARNGVGDLLFKAEVPAWL